MSASSKKVIIAALIGNCLIALTKFIAAAISGSSAMLSEGIHSLVDTGNQVMLLYGLRAARKPADADFPFGHGKEVYFWSFVVAILIFAVGSGVSLYEGVLRLMDPEPMEHVYINYIVLVLAMMFEGAAWYFAFREFNTVRGKRGYVEAVKQGKDPSMFVVLFEDSAAMLGLAVAFFATLASQLTGNVIFDGVASIIIGLILAGTAIWLAYETKGLLIGESANPAVVDGIRAITLDTPHIDHLNEVLTMHMGPNYILVTISIDFQDDIDADMVELTTADISRRIKQVYPQVKRIFIEAEKRQQMAMRKNIQEL
jgi:cation diffusion facilitator family transporter